MPKTKSKVYDDPHFHDMWKRGVTLTDMAQFYGVTKKAILVAADRRNFEARKASKIKWTEEMDKKIWQLRVVEGLPIRDVLKQVPELVNRSASVVSARAKKLTRERVVKEATKVPKSPSPQIPCEQHSSASNPKLTEKYHETAKFFDPDYARLGTSLGNNDDSDRW